MHDSQEPVTTSRFDAVWPKLAWLVYALTIPVRAWYVFVWHDPQKFIYSDMATYVSQAVLFTDPTYTQGIADTIYPPGTGYLFGFLFRLGGDSLWPVVLSQFVGSCVIPILVYAIAARLFSRRTALAALVLASLYFHFLAYAGFFLSETVYTVLVLLAFWFIVMAVQATDPLRQVLCSLLVGWTVGSAAAVKSGILLPFFLLALGIASIFVIRRRILAFVSLAAIAAGALALVLAPLAMRATKLCDGQFCLVSTNAEMNFLMGHSGRSLRFVWNDAKRNYRFEFAHPASVQKGYDEPRTLAFGPYDRKENLAAAWAWIGDHPWEAFAQSVDHVYDYFTGTVPWPSSHGPERVAMTFFERLYAFFWLVPAAAMVLRLIPRWLRRERGYAGDFLAVMPVAGMTVVSFLTIAEPRYRVPFDGFTCILAARFYTTWWSRDVEPGRSILPADGVTDPVPVAAETRDALTGTAEPAPAGEATPAPGAVAPSDRG